MSKQLILVVTDVVFLIVTLVINFLSTTPSGINSNSQTSLSSKYEIPITPPGYAFAIWGVIYLWQSLWLLALFVLTVAKFAEYKTSGKVTFSVLFHIGWIASCIGNSAWIICFAFEQLTICAVVLALTAISIYSMAYASHKYIGLAQEAKVTDNEALKQQFLSWEVAGDSNIFLILYKILVNNAVTFYGTWVSIATCLGIGIFWIFVGGAEEKVTSFFCLFILTVLFSVYLFLDFVYLRRWLIDTYGPYPVLLWALTAIATKPNSDDLPSDSPIRTWCFVLVGLTAAGLLAKIASAVMYYAKGGLAGYLSNTPKTSTTVVDPTEYQNMSQL